MKIRMNSKSMSFCHFLTQVNEINLILQQLCPKQLKHIKMNSKLPLIALLVLCFFVLKQADAQTDFTGVSRLNLTSKTQKNFTEVSFQSEGQKSPLQLFKKPKLKYSLLDSKSRASSFPKYSNNHYTTTQNDQKMNLNRRLKYSSLWAFTCLNYLYADVIGLMDMNLLNQYQ